MSKAAPTDPPSSRKVLLIPAVLLTLLVALPWALEIAQRFWTTPALSHLRSLIESGITLLLGIWVLRLIQREQQSAHRHLREMEQLSITDPLTGLGNRRAFERDLELRLSRARRTGEPVALLYLDVDALKKLNDRHGHSVGDETLRILASTLRSSSRQGMDVGFRVGGDEFVMLLQADRGVAETITKRIASAFHERSPRSSKVSLGVVIWDGESSVSHLLDEADSRMYRHKHPGSVASRAERLSNLTRPTVAGRS